MQQFTSILPSSLGSLTFYFNRIYTASGIRYHVSTLYKGSKSIMFSMEMDDLNWKIMNSDICPDWIREIENDLSNTINLKLSQRLN